MSQAALISAEELAAAIDRCVVVDCRHELGKPDAGAQAYAAAHIPGAHFLHGDHDLAGPPNGRNGRHPLPDREMLAARLRACGLNRGQQLVAYDAHGGMYAARLWWLARWLGHAPVAVLDGGLEAWRRERLPLATEVPAPGAGDFQATDSLTLSVSAADIQAALGGDTRLVIDARASER